MRPALLLLPILLAACAPRPDTPEALVAQARAAHGSAAPRHRRGALRLSRRLLPRRARPGRAAPSRACFGTRCAARPARSRSRSPRRSGRRALRAPWPAKALRSPGPKAPTRAASRRCSTRSSTSPCSPTTSPTRRCASSASPTPRFGAALLHRRGHLCAGRRRARLGGPLRLLAPPRPPYARLPRLPLPHRRGRHALPRRHKRAHGGRRPLAGLRELHRPHASAPALKPIPNASAAPTLQRVSDVALASVEVGPHDPSAAPGGCEAGAAPVPPVGTGTEGAPAPNPARGAR